MISGMNGVGSLWSAQGLLIWVGGAASTVAGSWLTNKMQRYYQAKHVHRDELVQKVLEPIHDFLRSLPEKTAVKEDSGRHTYNPKAPSTEHPTTYEPVIMVEDPGSNIYKQLDEALFEDTRVHHYHDLMADLEAFKNAWSAHLQRRKEWVEHMACRILAASGLSTDLSAASGGPKNQILPYVKQLSLAMFVYNRLLYSLPTAMKTDIQPVPAGQQELLILKDTDGSTYFARGTPDRINYLTTFINDLLEGQRQQASDISKEWEQLEGKRSGLSRRFSLEVATKNFNRCPLVSFFRA